MPAVVPSTIAGEDSEIAWKISSDDTVDDLEVPMGVATIPAGIREATFHIGIRADGFAEGSEVVDIAIECPNLPRGWHISPETGEHRIAIDASDNNRRLQRRELGGCASPCCGRFNRRRNIRGYRPFHKRGAVAGGHMPHPKNVSHAYELRHSKEAEDQDEYTTGNIFRPSKRNRQSRLRSMPSMSMQASISMIPCEQLGKSICLLSKSRIFFSGNSCSLESNLPRAKKMRGS